MILGGEQWSACRLNSSDHVFQNLPMSGLFSSLLNVSSPRKKRGCQKTKHGVHRRNSVSLRRRKIVTCFKRIMHLQQPAQAFHETPVYVHMHISTPLDGPPDPPHSSHTFSASFQPCASGYCSSAGSSRSANAYEASSASTEGRLSMLTTSSGVGPSSALVAGSSQLYVVEVKMVVCRGKNGCMQR